MKKHLTEAGIVVSALFIVAAIILLSDYTGRSGKKKESTAPQPKVILTGENISDWSVAGLKKNLFTTAYDPGFMWLSVSTGAYSKQYYSRDTFITFLGAASDERIRPQVSHAIDWFGKHIKQDGYLPIWYDGNKSANEFLYCPFNANEYDGGIKQLDHILEFILAIHTDYLKTRDLEVLKYRLPYLDSVLAYLDGKTSQSLLVGDFSVKCGNDWADQIHRSGKSSFVNALWYAANRSAEKMYRENGDPEKSQERKVLADKIRQEYNNAFWTVSQPVNCETGNFGHYVSWIREGVSYDYFDLDGNTLAVASGLADEESSKEIIKEITSRWSYYVNSYGATRVLCGTYNPDVTLMEKNNAQNGGYWYINSYFLTAALSKTKDKTHMEKLRESTIAGSNRYYDRGLTEWYYENGKEGGAMNYSWSMAYPLFLSSVLRQEENVLILQ